MFDNLLDSIGLVAQTDKDVAEGILTLAGAWT